MCVCVCVRKTIENRWEPVQSQKKKEKKEEENERGENTSNAAAGVARTCEALSAWRTRGHAQVGACSGGVSTVAGVSGNECAWEREFPGDEARECVSGAQSNLQVCAHRLVE